MSEKNKKFMFSDVLASSIPPEIVDAMESSNKELFMEKVKEASKTTWWIFKQVLGLFQTGSGENPLVKSAAGDLLQFLEQCETMGDAQGDLFQVTLGMAALQHILARIGDSDIPEPAKGHLQDLVDRMGIVTMSIKRLSLQGRDSKYTFIGDRERVVELLQSLVPIIDLFMGDPNIQNGVYLIQTETKPDDSASNEGTVEHASIETTSSSPDVPPVPLSIEIDFYDRSKPLGSLESSPEIAPKPLSHEIDFYDSDFEDISGSVEKVPEPQSLDIVLGISEDIEVPSNPSEADAMHHDLANNEDSVEHANIETGSSSPDVPPVPLSVEIDFYDRNDPSEDLESSAEVAPKLLSHEVDFYDTNFENSPHSAEKAPEPQSPGITMHGPEDIGGLSDPSREGEFVHRETISDLQQASVLPLDDHHNIPQTPTNLGRLFTSQPARSGDIAGIDEKIHDLEHKLDSIPNDHNDKPLLLTKLATVLTHRFDQSGEITDVNKAICVQENALDLSSLSDVNKSSMLNNLGCLFMRQFKQLEEIEYIDKAIFVLEYASGLTSDSHPDKYSILMNLGISFIHRFEMSAEMVYLNEALPVLKRALDFISNDHPDKSLTLMNLGVALMYLSEQSGEITDLHEAISALQQAIDFMSNNHPDKPRMLMNVGILLERRSDRLGELADVDQAILALQQAIDLTPDAHLNKPLMLEHLGNLMRRRSERLGEVAGIDHAILVQRQGVDLIPDDHPDKPLRLANLGVSWTRRFELTRDVLDINHAIVVLQHSLDLTPVNHAKKPSILTNLANSLLHRFEYLKDTNDINRAILIQQQALNLTPNGHPAKPLRLTNLGNLLFHRFGSLRKIEDINKAIHIQQQCLDLIPNEHANKPIFLQRLGHFYEVRFQTSYQNNDIFAAISAFQQASCLHSGSPSVRFQAARDWARLSAQHSTEVKPSLDAYAMLASLVPYLVLMESLVFQRSYDIHYVDAAIAEAAAFACSCGNLGLALEWLEQGRPTLWDQTLCYRDPIARLALNYPDLHRALQDVAQQLGHSYTMRQQEISASDVMSEELLSLEEATKRHCQLTERCENLLSQVQACPGYQDFLQPKRFSEFFSLSQYRTIVVINVTDKRCDALVIRQKSSFLEHIHLLNLSKWHLSLMNSSFPELATSENLLSLKGLRGKPMMTEVRRGPPRSSSPRSPRSPRPPRPSKSPGPSKYYLTSEKVLSMLWNDIVKPVVQFLGFQVTKHSTELPYIIWCLTGPLSSLPLHAAGDYVTKRNSKEKLFNYAVSSYTPTLTTLLNSAQEHPNDSEFRGLLAISQPATPGLSPLPNTVLEVEKIQNLMAQHHSGFYWLDNSQAIVQRILDNVDQYSWIHFACHGVVREDDPTQSAFALYDGLLTLEQIAQKPLGSARFIFLSACQPLVVTGDESPSLPMQSIQLGAGMLAVGFKSVIAPLWPVRDSDVPEVAEDVYKELLNNTETSNDRPGAAYALHQAIGRLRERVGETNFISWAPFIHLGL